MIAKMPVPLWVGRKRCLHFSAGKCSLATPGTEEGCVNQAEPGCDPLGRAGREAGMLCAVFGVTACPHFSSCSHYFNFTG